MRRIHIVGASGSGTTTLGKHLAARLLCTHLDADDYFWEPTDPPFTTERSVEERLRLLTENTGGSTSWVLSGSLVGWGDPLLSYFTHVVFLQIPKELRLARLKDREAQRYGNQIQPGGELYQSHLDFMDWAAKYDDGTLDVRSLALHNEWLKKLKCPVIRIEGPLSTVQQVSIVLKELGLGQKALFTNLKALLEQEKSL